MVSPGTLTVLVFALSLGLAALLVARPVFTANRGGKVLAFLGLFLLPVLCSVIGSSAKMESSKETTFCLSCHIMEPYGKSLWVDDPHYVAAAHFQNHRVPADQVCYTCHTDYVLYGGIRAKWRGLHHVYVQYLGKPMNPIRLYVPYNNRECLHCHLGARSFEESPTHAALRSDLVSNQTSCMTSGCHDTVHNTAGLGTVKFWQEPSQ
ncbi:MAG: NapC/NirT family cytochrome c [Candidatus Sulfotelmatobacter sp.]